MGIPLKKIWRQRMLEEEIMVKFRSPYVNTGRLVTYYVPLPEQVIEDLTVNAEDTLRFRKTPEGEYIIEVA